MQASPAPGPDAAAATSADPAAPIASLKTDPRRLATTVVAIVVVVAALSLAQVFFISLLLGIFCAYTLNPLVAHLTRLRVPRAIGTVVVMASVLGALGAGVYSLRGQLETIVQQLPEAAKTFSGALAELHGDPGGNLQQVQKAAAEVEKATAQAAGEPASNRRPPTHVVIDSPGFKLGNYLLLGSMGALGLLGQAVMVLFLTFFLLQGGDLFKRKFVHLAGPSLSRRKITVRILDDINASIQQYLLMLLTTNVLVALLAWVAFHWIGLDNAGAWAAAFGLLHVVPYLGPAVAAAAVGMAAYMQFASFPMAFLAVAATLAIATFVGTFVATWMTGRIARMNSAGVFIALLFWGWLWGVWGMLLSIPIIVITKVVAQHIGPLRPVADLLGE